MSRDVLSFAGRLTDMREWFAGILGPWAQSASDEDLRRAVTQRLQQGTELVDGQQLAFVPTQDECITHGLDTAGTFTGTLLARSFLVVGTFRVVDAAGTHVGNLDRTFRAARGAEAQAWRRHAEIELGDDDAVRSSTDEQLRRALTQKLEDQAHAIDVMAECAAAGDCDGILMHAQHLCGATPDLSVGLGEVTRGR